MLKARGDFAAEALPGGRVVVMGGETSNGTATGMLYNSLHCAPNKVPGHCHVGKRMKMHLKCELTCSQLSLCMGMTLPWLAMLPCCTMPLLHHADWQDVQCRVMKLSAAP
jgi:hypothetical protein